MRYSSIFFICLFTACGTAPEKSGCGKVKTGEFQMAGNEIAPDQKWTIVRNDSIQTEINHNSGQINTLSVKWLNDCEYELRYLHSQPEDTSSSVVERRKRVVHVKITGVEENFYEFTIVPTEKDDIALSSRMRILKKN
ncbi:hypothetical protein ACFOTA_24100 [Chitinophaga sp. GCM10012297]|uniref:Uncharacterized protein n=1 Tax=Chitinophaga chungangae TaxID=2821488 RepID=A0ABS3YKT6_9BACT|nr:hypothetical protein [Chitinophaga chungangae]MBO9155315.1 hypothetical protein [Chitinophaga chungangae]